MAHKDETVVRCTGHLQWIRGHECSIAGRRTSSIGDVHICDGKTQAAHVRRNGDGGMAMKPGDNRTIPLCHKAHAHQHQIGELAFELLYRINMAEIAAELWRTSLHRRKWEQSHAHE